MGMHAGSYWFAGGFEDWFLDCDSELAADDLADYFRATVFANGGDTTGEVDALSATDGVTLRKTNGAYPASGVLTQKRWNTAVRARCLFPVNAFPA